MKKSLFGARRVSLKLCVYVAVRSANERSTTLLVGRCRSSTQKRTFAERTAT